MVLKIKNLLPQTILATAHNGRARAIPAESKDGASVTVEHLLTGNRE
jgi:hypothetical protein